MISGSDFRLYRERLSLLIVAERQKPNKIPINFWLSADSCGRLTRVAPVPDYNVLGSNRRIRKRGQHLAKGVGNQTHRFSKHTEQTSILDKLTFVSYNKGVSKVNSRHE